VRREQADAARPRPTATSMALALVLETVRARKRGSDLRMEGETIAMVAVEYYLVNVTGGGLIL